MFSFIRFLGMGYHTHNYRTIINNTIYDTKRSELVTGRDFLLWSVAFWIGRNGGYFMTIKGVPFSFFGSPFIHVDNNEELQDFLRICGLMSDYERLFCFDLKDI